MSDTSAASLPAGSAAVRDPAATIKLALVLSAVAALALVAWNVFAALS